MLLSFLLFKIPVPRSRGVPGRQWGGKHRRYKPVGKGHLLTLKKIEDREKSNMELLATPFLTTPQMQKVALYRKALLKLPQA